MMYVHWLHEVEPEAEALVGGKGANLARLARAGLPVPIGFCVSTLAYEYFVLAAGLAAAVDGLIARSEAPNYDQLKADATELQERFVAAVLPDTLAHETMAAYRDLGSQTGLQQPSVAVRSSGTAEDLSTASVAGQHDSYLSVRGEERLDEHIRRCWASLWNPHAIHYRHDSQIEQRTVSMSVVVQQMVNSVSAGVLFTVNPVSGDRSEMLINASWGLGESVVSGVVEPDSITLDKGSMAIKAYSTGLKETMIQPTEFSGTEATAVPAQLREQPALSESQIIELGKLALMIEVEFGVPQDIEWAHDGTQFSILQSRPVTGLP